MFIGRDKELKSLEDLYSSNRFEFLVVYGRRRVGKTELLKQFACKHKCIFYQAQEKNNTLNIKAFANALNLYYDTNYEIKFDDWYDILKYLDSRIQTSNERTVIIIDEFPFIAKDYPAIKSLLQQMIDISWKDRNVMLVLCGSSVSFMVNEVLGYSSPLYGRRTFSMEVLPFDYYTASQFFPNFSEEDRLLAYGILGGIPLYLSMFDSNISIKENIKKNILTVGSFLNEEVIDLLKMEFREPKVYNSILTAIANGSSKINQIKTKINEESSKVSKYLNELMEIKLVRKVVPYGEKSDSKNTIYEICDNYFVFWFRYVFKLANENSLLSLDTLADIIYNDLSDYMGGRFEKICQQYLTRLTLSGHAPFMLSSIGRWWGTNNKLKKQDDIDILGISGDNVLFCECKFRNELFDMREYRDFVNVTDIFGEYKNKYYYLFLKSDCSEAVKKELTSSWRVITLKDLFDKNLLG